MRAIAILGVLLLGACNGTTGPATSDFESLPADQVLTGVEHSTTVDGIRRAKVLSDTTLVFNDSASVHLIGVNLETYDANGRVSSRLNSQSGQLDRNTQAMIARGKVVLNVLGAQPRTITTEELHYDPQSGRIWSNVNACERRGAQTLCGSSFSATVTETGVTNVQVTNYRGTGIRIE